MSTNHLTRRPSRRLLARTVATLSLAVSLIGCPDETETGAAAGLQDAGADTDASPGLLIPDVASPDVPDVPGPDATNDLGLDADSSATDLGAADVPLLDVTGDVADPGDSLSDAILQDGGMLPDGDAADGDADTMEPPLEGILLPIDLSDPVSNALFPMGVSAGAARPDSVIVWTRYALADAGGVELTMRVWRELDGEEQVVMVVNETVLPADGGYVKRRIEGLLPDHEYRYAWFTADGRSPIGRVRTALAPGESRAITIAATSCTRQNFAPFDALTRMTEGPGDGLAIDATVHVGDISYNDDAKNLEEFRIKWASTLEAQGYRDFFSAAGLYATWDDHEVDNNWNPETIDPAVRQAATDSYFETLPNDRGENDRIWERYAWGDAVEFFILDCRGERKPSTLLSESPQYISPEQLDWLTTGLLGSSAHFKVILNSVPITDMPFWYFGETDRWEGFAAQRTALLEFIAQQGITGVWFLGGDFHIGFVAQLDPMDGLAANIREVAVGPGGNFNPAGLLTFPPEQFSFQHGEPAAPTWITFDPEADTVRVVFESMLTGETLHDQTYPGSL